MTALNIDLLRTALDAIEANPEQWDQRAWATRTETGDELYSLAARVCLLVGDEINWDRVNDWGNATWLTNGQTIIDAANELLGLGVFDAHELHDVDNDIAKARKVGERLIKRAKRGRASR